MKHALGLSAVFANTTARNAVQRVIENFMPGKATWGDIILVPHVDESGAPALSFTGRFDSEATADALRGLLHADLPGRSWQRGRLVQHVCTHDEVNPGPCTTGTEVVK